jgi:arginase
MPAVDYRLPDGLSWDEPTTLLRVVVSDDRAVGLDITIFNPTLDPDGRIASALVDSLVVGLSR